MAGDLFETTLIHVFPPVLAFHPLKKISIFSITRVKRKNRNFNCEYFFFLHE